MPIIARFEVKAQDHDSRALLDQTAFFAPKGLSKSQKIEPRTTTSTIKTQNLLIVLVVVVVLGPLVVGKSRTKHDDEHD
jgi:hypothetical protein